MKTIWKYPMKIQGTTMIEMPEGANVVRVGTQEGTVCLWVCVLPDAPKKARNFFISGTGHPVPLKAGYIGSVGMGPFEWHVWEE